MEPQPSNASAAPRVASATSVIPTEASSPARDAVVVGRGVYKEYSGRAVVCGIDFTVERRECVGFLGPNGAGKSTSVKMLLGLVRPSAGWAQVLGCAPGDPAAMRRVGFLPEHFRFHEWLPAAEFLDLHGRLLQMDRETRRRRIPEVLELVGLSEHARRPLSDFSKGMLQRVGLAQALLNDPELVFLDEPTSALDPFGRMLVRSVIRGLRERGTTVFLNSHLLGEVEATCDRVAFIREGRVLRTIALRDLGAEQVEVELRLDRLDPELLAWLREISGDRVQVTGEQQRKGAADGLDASEPASPVSCQLTIDSEELLPLIAARVVASGARLYALTPRRLSLEQLFLDVVGDRDSGA